MSVLPSSKEVSLIVPVMIGEEAPSHSPEQSSGEWVRACASAEEVPMNLLIHTYPIENITDSDWNITADLFFPNETEFSDENAVIDICIEWRHGEYLFLSNFENRASPRLVSSQRFSPDEIRAFSGIGHYIFCLVLETSMNKWSFMLDHGENTMVVLTAYSTEGDDERLSRYYSTLGFERYYDPSIEAGIPMRATIGTLMDKCNQES